LIPVALMAMLIVLRTATVSPFLMRGEVS
jgi:hypothetical protein